MAAKQTAKTAEKAETAEKAAAKKPLSLKEKLMHIQCELKVDKTRKNDFGGYMYRSDEDIYNGVKTYLNVYKCVLLLTDDILEIGGKAYIKSTATLSDVDSNESISVSGFAQESEHGKMTGDQQTYAASSYARKNALGAMFLLTGSDEGQAKPEKKLLVCEKCGQVIDIPKGWSMQSMIEYFNKENNGKVECRECRGKKKG